MQNLTFIEKIKLNSVEDNFLLRFDWMHQLLRKWVYHGINLYFEVLFDVCQYSWPKIEVLSFVKEMRHMINFLKLNIEWVFTEIINKFTLNPEKYNGSHSSKLISRIEVRKQNRWSLNNNQRSLEASLLQRSCSLL